MNWLALDIGGANIKVADGLGFAGSYAFPLWKESPRLAHELRTILAESPPADHLAVTMTGELADCFEAKTAGVRFILRAAAEAADQRHLRIYFVDGRLVSPPVADSTPLLAAATNWHALARFAGRYAPAGTALLLDVGSTTCDVIPLVDGKPATRGQTDTQRLLSGELVYTGVERSPVCALLARAPYRGRMCGIAQELFATMRDVYLVLDQLPDEPHSLATADGRPATKKHATARLARMLAADESEFNERDAVELAEAAANAQTALLAAAIEQVLREMWQPPQKIILAGHGDFLAAAALAKAAVHAPLISLSHELGKKLARVGPAHALAVLALEAVGS